LILLSLVTARFLTVGFTMAARRGSAGLDVRRFADHCLI
jgi:hypothetical protein